MDERSAGLWHVRDWRFRRLTTRFEDDDSGCSDLAGVRVLSFGASTRPDSRARDASPQKA